MGVAKTQRSASQASNHWPLSSSITTRRKSAGVLTGATTKAVLSEAVIALAMCKGVGYGGQGAVRLRRAGYWRDGTMDKL